MSVGDFDEVREIAATFRWLKDETGAEDWVVLDLMAKLEAARAERRPRVKEMMEWPSTN